MCDIPNNNKIKMTDEKDEELNTTDESEEEEEIDDDDDDYKKNAFMNRKRKQLINDYICMKTNNKPHIISLYNKLTSSPSSLSYFSYQNYNINSKTFKIWLLVINIITISIILSIFIIIALSILFWFMCENQLNYLGVLLIMVLLMQVIAELQIRKGIISINNKMKSILQNDNTDINSESKHLIDRENFKLASAIGKNIHQQQQPCRKSVYKRLNTYEKCRKKIDILCRKAYSDYISKKFTIPHIQSYENILSKLQYIMKIYHTDANEIIEYVPNINKLSAGKMIMGIHHFIKATQLIIFIPMCARMWVNISNLILLFAGKSKEGGITDNNTCIGISIFFIIMSFCTIIFCLTWIYYKMVELISKNEDTRITMKNSKSY